MDNLSWDISFSWLVTWNGLRQLKDPAERGLFGGNTFGAHEFGHLFFSSFGEFMTIAGGSLMQLLIPMGAIALLTLVNVRGVKLGGGVMTVFTTVKVAALLGLIAAVFLSGKGSGANFLPWWPESWSTDLTAAFGLAMISALWAYDGWIDVTQTAGEFKNPRRKPPPLAHHRPPGGECHLSAGELRLCVRAAARGHARLAACRGRRGFCRVNRFESSGASRPRAVLHGASGQRLLL